MHLLRKTPSAENPVRTPSLQKAQVCAGRARGKGAEDEAKGVPAVGSDTVVCFQDKSSAHDDQLLHAETSSY